MVVLSIPTTRDIENGNFLTKLKKSGIRKIIDGDEIDRDKLKKEMSTWTYEDGELDDAIDGMIESIKAEGHYLITEVDGNYKIGGREEFNDITLYNSKK